MKLKTIVLSMLLGSNIAAAHADAIRIKGTITQKVPVSTATKTFGIPKERTIKLLKVELPPSFKNKLAQSAQKALQSNASTAFLSKNSNLPSATQLDMGEVPVLDQGEHGTCVTFAVTAAMDAILGKGDYISQACSLQLGNYLETNGYEPSGWEGSWGSIVHSQMSKFGIVNKDHEASIGCGGITGYPAHGTAPLSSITPDAYHEISEPLEGIAWSPILDLNDASERYDTNQTLDLVKKSLAQGDRVTFGVLLVDFDLGFMGAVGSKNQKFDSWVLTPEIARDVYMNFNPGGHEMIITGYDDKAVAVDDKGRKHKGLLTLRNSWSDEVGDKGNFYMSYDYFKLLVIEAARIRQVYVPGAE